MAGSEQGQRDPIKSPLDGKKGDALITASGARVHLLLLPVASMSAGVVSILLPLSAVSAVVGLRLSHSPSI